MGRKCSGSKNRVNELLRSLSCPKLPHLASTGDEMKATMDKTNR